MDSETPAPPQPSLSAAIADVKSAGSTLFEAYISEGMKDAMGTTGRVALTRFTIIAVSALAVGLSLYGFIFETLIWCFTLAWTETSPEVVRMATHAVIVVSFGIVALVLTRKKENA